jgi:hypothetical protein
MVAMLTAAATVMTLAQNARDLPIGTAAGSGEAFCVAFVAANLSPGTVVTLVDQDPTETTRVGATIGERLSACHTLAKHNVPGPYYRLVLPSKEEGYGPMIAFVGDAQISKDPSGAATFRLSARYPRVQVRECTSHEGVHLTVWEGAPLRSTRVWRQYVYLGYDVEPSCQDEDTRGRP